MPRVLSKMEHYRFKEAHNVPVQEKLVRKKNLSGTEKIDLI